MLRHVHWTIALRNSTTPAGLSMACSDQSSTDHLPGVKSKKFKIFPDMGYNGYDMLWL